MKNIQINPDLDIHFLREQYQKTGRLQIPHFFTDATALYLLELITHHDTWYFAYNNGNNYYESTVEEVELLPKDTYQKFIGNIEARAGNGFQYAFNQYYISQAKKLGEQVGHPIHDIDTFLNSESFFTIVKAITGVDDINQTDSYISSYKPRHFLTSHDDKHHKHNRVAAFTLGMNQYWDRNWGGYLAFYDDKDNIKEAFKPNFNTLNIFSVPQLHAVQQVTAFAQKDRLSYLGWLLK